MDHDPRAPRWLIFTVMVLLAFTATACVVAVLCGCWMLAGADVILTLVNLANLYFNLLPLSKRIKIVGKIAQFRGMR